MMSHLAFIIRSICNSWIHVHIYGGVFQPHVATLPSYMYIHMYIRTYPQKDHLVESQNQLPI